MSASFSYNPFALGTGKEITINTSRGAVLMSTEQARKVADESGNQFALEYALRHPTKVGTVSSKRGVRAHLRWSVA